MAHSNFHPAPGMGQMLPGWFAVPQNPISGASVRYQPSMGEIIAADFTVPQNPIIRASVMGVMPEQGKALEVSGLGYGCGCGCDDGGGCGCKGNGMGSLTEDLQTKLNEGIAFATDGGTGTIVTVLLAGLLLYSFTGGSAYRDKAAALKSEYSLKLRELKSRYPSTLRRAKRKVSGLLS